MTALNTDRLPVRLVPLVGRQRELHEVTGALSRSRLMSLTGPGGTGKTRLALAATNAARAQFPGGVCWVELAPIADPGLVAQAVAAALGVPEHPGEDPAVTVAGHIGDRGVLIVLDNCEHLAAAVAGLADRLLAACPALSILTTSREQLGVDGERPGRYRHCPCRTPAQRRTSPNWPDSTRSGSSSSGRSSCCRRSS